MFLTAKHEKGCGHMILDMQGYSNLFITWEAYDRHGELWQICITLFSVLVFLLPSYVTHLNHHQRHKQL